MSREVIREDDRPQDHLDAERDDREAVELRIITAERSTLGKRILREAKSRVAAPAAQVVRGARPATPAVRAKRKRLR
jgi:hypothetical protein